ncbi:MAG: division/cell wall cluster transcriptional repressor MraZ [Oscillospiraceae bacterium]|jgi:MraZ protein|nr:division/cell wall cluster transcriptional repressor MraZ [Oscillospiraceae bacterium]
MTGEYNHNVDAKGRLFMPVKLREELGESFYVCKGLDGCLFVYSPENWERLVQKVSQMPISARRVLFPTAYKCESDSQGRILLTQKLRDHASLVKSVTIVGMGNHAEIWCSRKWEEKQQEPAEELAEIFNSLGF